MGISWDPSLAVGIREIDEQHQEIFRRVGVLLGNLRRGQDREELEKLIAFLGEYLHEHFGAEEGLMLLFHYPLIGPHRAQHRAFVEAFVAFKAELDRGPSATFADRLSAHLTGWLRDHIGSSDRELGKFLVEAGAAGRPAPAAKL